MRSKRLQMIAAPSDLGLRRTGVHGLPEALHAAGLLDGLDDVRHGGRLPVPAYGPLRDRSAGVRNLEGIHAFSVQLAEQVASALDADRFPLVLGGDCSILLGTTLALRRRGRYGLFFLDGHADFYSPEAEPNGEVASMDLAIVTGRAPDALADLDGLRPLVRERDVVVFGYRDAESAARYGSPDVCETAMHVLDLTAVRQLGPAEAARQGRTTLEENRLDGFWVHLDADVLSDDVMPAVDYRMPGGLRPEELVEALAVVLASPLAVGMEVTIYNPALDDTERSAGRVLARIVNQAIATAT